MMRNKFDEVFEEAIKKGLLKCDSEIIKQIDSSFHNAEFNNWLQEKYAIELAEKNYDSVCTYENFKTYFREEYPFKLNLKERIKPLGNWLKKDSGYGNAKWVIGMIFTFLLGIFLSWLKFKC